MKLIIIRHGDPDYSIDSLTEKGFYEAELLAHRIEKMNVDYFYVSPLGRARDTLAPALKRLNKSAEILDWLREFPPRIKKIGEDSEDCSWDWLPSVWTEVPEFYDKDKWKLVPCFAEKNMTLEYKKVTDGLDALLKKHGYEKYRGYYKAISPNSDTIVLVCHFGLECVLLSHLFGVSPMTLWHGTCAAPTSVTILNTEERRDGIAYFRMSSFGDISHLYKADEKPAFAARFCEMYSNQDERHD